MRSRKGLYLFYRKITFPALSLSALLAAFGTGYVSFSSGLGISFIFVFPMFHYLSYEIRYPNEYFFYYNLGLSRSTLWAATTFLGLTIGITLLYI